MKGVRAHAQNLSILVECQFAGHDLVAPVRVAEK